MALKLRNTLSGELETFEPIGKTVKMYNCGQTVYDHATIGNLRSYIFADTLRRTLDALGYTVKQIINITDFGHLVSDADEGEDKMTKGLRREGLAITMENMHTLAERYTEAFLCDITQIGVDTGRITFPRASDYIAQQIELIKTLEQKGYAYNTPSGVYFDTAKYKNYGMLGGINLVGQQARARVELGDKHVPQDFVLWKPDDKLGWESPWGLGFPGWHTECVAMIFALLGEQIDIHTGGIDHIPVHHNNEIAQAESASDKSPFVRYWMHNAFLTIDENRVGKSQGNAILLKDVVERGMHPRALRYWYLTAHYRSPVNFTWEALEGAYTALKRLKNAFHESSKSDLLDEVFLTKFYAAIADDLDTPKALALVWENIKNLNRATLADEREAARKNKDFARSDTLRTQIESKGFIVKDTSAGPEISPE